MYSDYSEDSDTRIDYYDISKQKTISYKWQ